MNYALGDSPAVAPLAPDTAGPQGIVGIFTRR
jgi:hypothetical protein